MAKRPYSTGVSDQLHFELMGSPDAREKRRQDHLAQLPLFIGGVMLGRKREVSSETTWPPQVIPVDMIRDLGKCLREVPGPLMDKFSGNQQPDPSAYNAYAMGGNRHNRRVETDPEEKKQARLARQRQTKIVADGVNQNAWQQHELARLFHAGLRSVQKSLRDGSEPQEQALRYSAAAIEDLGYCLEDKGVLLSRTTYGHMLPKWFIHIGTYGATEPQSLLAQHQDLFRLVQIEETKREEYWSERFEAYQAIGGDRLTQQHYEDAAANDAIIAGLLE